MAGGPMTYQVRKPETWEKRKRILRAVGAHCRCCPESRIEFLTLEHIDGKNHAGRIRSTLKELKRAAGIGMDSGKFTILCFNCNMSRSHNGYCPHDLERMGNASFTIGDMIAENRS